MERDALYLNMSKEEFLDNHLVREEFEEGYQTKHKPCDFLEACYTNQPERLLTKPI